MTSLRQRMIEDMQIRNLAVHSQNTYVLQVSMFARHFGKSPEMLGNVIRALSTAVNVLPCVGFSQCCDNLA